MNQKQAFFRILQVHLDRPLDQCLPVYLSGWQTVEALWPLNARFRPVLEKVRGFPYDRAFEAEADTALEAFAFDVGGADWGGLSAQAWRVLLERQQQAIGLALASEVAGNPLMPLPEGFPESARTAAAALFLLHSMRLPFPVVDRSSLELPPGGPPASLRPH